MSVRFSTPRVLGFSWGTTLRSRATRATQADEDAMTPLVVLIWGSVLLAAVCCGVGYLVAGVSGAERGLGITVWIVAGIVALFVALAALSLAIIVAMVPISLVLICIPSKRHLATRYWQSLRD